jgi:hypothetical protein
MRWSQKKLWRPATAIRAADTDGNLDTGQGPNCTPLITTPNHQSYVAFHASLSEAAAQSLANTSAPTTSTFPPRQRACRL